jgi:NTE family protein
LQGVLRAGRIVACSALLVACAQVIHNDPINQPLQSGLEPSAELSRAVDTYYDDTVVALSFSGGGTRAAAFSFGALTALDETPIPNRSTSMLDRVDFVTGVSGGSVLAAYYGLKKRKALADFKQRFLLRNAEENLQMNLSLLNIARGLQGGINDPTLFPRWLDDNLFDHATFKSLLFQRRPYIWINASDIYNRTPFVFGRVIFGQLCSDLASYPISLAVAASAAVPVVFAPVVVEAYPGRCSIPLPDWVERVRNNADAPPLLKLFANALQRYHSGEVRYVKLLDGGMVDNYGLAGFTIARLASSTPYGPLEPEEAVKLRRLLFLVVDAGRAPSGAWVQTVEGPSGVNLITAASDTATESGAVGSYSAFQDTMDDWQEKLVNWR